jgi:rhodanese-related sulfurtransferase
MILAAGIGLGLGYNALRPQPLPWVAKPLPQMKSLDSLGTSSDSTSSSLSHPQIIELGNKESTTVATRVERQRIDTMPVAPPIGAIDSATHSVTKPAPSSAETTTTPPTRPADTTSVKAAPPASNAYSDIPESEDPIKISLSQAKKFFDRGGVVILDARDPEEYAEGHISGALSAPTDSKMGDIEWLKTMSKDPRPIICYCGGGDCELSIELATELTRTGHRRVLVFEDGFPAWQSAGYPVQEGSAP